MPPDPPQQIQVPLSWVGYDEEPILFANQFIVQFQPDHSGFVLATGQATAPAIVGTPEQVAEQAAEITFIPVRTLSRVGFSPEKMRELIAALQVNLENYENYKAQFMDPRGEA